MYSFIVSTYLYNNYGGHLTRGGLLSQLTLKLHVLFIVLFCLLAVIIIVASTQNVTCESSVESNGMEATEQSAEKLRDTICKRAIIPC